MNEEIFDPQRFASADAAKSHAKNRAEYDALYKESIEDNEGFWARAADEQLTWFEKWQTVKNCDFANAKIKWFEGGKLNLCYNAIDRHLETERKNKTAIIWQGDKLDDAKSYTYAELYEEVNHFSKVLKNMGVNKGDRITLYMPMIPELAFATLACARIGAVHSVIFGGFSPKSIKDRMHDAESKFVITSDFGTRGGKSIPMKQNVDTALDDLGDAGVKVLVVERTGDGVKMKDGRDFWYHEKLKETEGDADVAPEQCDAEDPLFILYTSGSTGKPKGVLHTTGGYGVYTSLTHKYIFDIREDDVYWCTADIGWITGHSYIIYGPLINGATSVMFEGVPTYPDVGRFWQVVEQHKITIFYTAPTAIRALMRHGDDPVKKYDRSSLRLLGTVGEPINPEAWLWYFNIVGEGRCPIVDTWWQTETGGVLLTPLPYAIAQKPGSATLPFFGIEPALVDADKSTELSGETTGHLCMKGAWPGMMRTVYGDQQRFFDTYFSQHRGYYFSGDECRRDADGYYWIIGRADDLLNVSGHRLGTAEVESALVEHKDVCEAAVVGFPHDVKGQGIYAYVTLNAGVEPSDEIKAGLVKLVAKEISPIAKPDVIHWAPALPKTRSGKIMRRILRKIAARDDNLGDTTTLADPSVVDALVADKPS